MDKLEKELLIEILKDLTRIVTSNLNCSYTTTKKLETSINRLEQREDVMTNEIRNCPDCNALPGQIHMDNCDVERCSVCGGQRFLDDCENHNKAFARWTGIWPGAAEASYLGINLNDLYKQGIEQYLFVEPKQEEV